MAFGILSQIRIKHCPISNIGGKNFTAGQRLSAAVVVGIGDGGDDDDDGGDGVSSDNHDHYAEVGVGTQIECFPASLVTTSGGGGRNEAKQTSSSSSF